jgi:hypothetical protein
MKSLLEADAEYPDRGSNLQNFYKHFSEVARNTFLKNKRHIDNELLKSI